ncbi:hypothetical protein G6L13_26015 [Agrobacterium tumefaciens]|uniref:hypothetical protein n=1 Tax=Agrobacterium tumefaciens TaxID=358 RepID=UPI00157409F9|nr:hypothetical protein [Agrobacterium tumefaciens]NTA83942.1 hypothetical protein [Agrobacterium tumefaciens]
MTVPDLVDRLVRRWSRSSGRERLGLLALMICAALLTQLSSVADFSRALACGSETVSSFVAQAAGDTSSQRLPSGTDLSSPIARQLAIALASHQQQIQNINYQPSAEEQRMGACIPHWSV